MSRARLRTYASYTPTYAELQQISLAYRNCLRRKIQNAEFWSAPNFHVINIHRWLFNLITRAERTNFQMKSLLIVGIDESGWLLHVYFAIAASLCFVSKNSYTNCIKLYKNGSIIFAIQMLSLFLHIFF